jgi:hypothetical protein
MQVVASNGTNATQTTLVDGMHTPRISIHYPNRMLLPAVAYVGDTVQLEFRVVSGSRFMIVGMALC